MQGCCYSRRSERKKHPQRVLKINRCARKGHVGTQNTIRKIRPSSRKSRKQSPYYRFAGRPITYSRSTKWMRILTNWNSTTK
jgi:hypothetical protein